MDWNFKNLLGMEEGRTFQTWRSNSKNEKEEKNLRNHQKDDLMRLTMNNKLRKKNEKTIESMN